MDTNRGTSTATGQNMGAHVHWNQAYQKHMLIDLIIETKRRRRKRIFTYVITIIHNNADNYNKCIHQMYT